MLSKSQDTSDKSEADDGTTENRVDGSQLSEGRANVPGLVSPLPPAPPIASDHSIPNKRTENDSTTLEPLAQHIASVAPSSGFAPAWHTAYDPSLHGQNGTEPPSFQSALQAALQRIHSEQHIDISKVASELSGSGADGSNTDAHHSAVTNEQHWQAALNVINNVASPALATTPWQVESAAHSIMAGQNVESSQTHNTQLDGSSANMIVSSSSPSPGEQGTGSAGEDHHAIISRATGGNATRFPSNMGPKPSTSMKAVPDPEDPNFAIITEVCDEITGKTRKIFRCAFPGCTKICNRLYNLKSHVLVHSNSRPFQCDHCAMSFARKHDLQRHLRSTHQKHKAFICDQCGLSFTRADAYRRHLIVEEKKRMGQPMTAEELQFETATHVAAAAAAAAAVVAGNTQPPTNSSAASTSTVSNTMELTNHFSVADVSGGRLSFPNLPTPTSSVTFNTDSPMAFLSMPNTRTSTDYMPEISQHEANSHSLPRLPRSHEVSSHPTPQNPSSRNGIHNNNSTPISGPQGDLQESIPSHTLVIPTQQTSTDRLSGESTNTQSGVKVEHHVDIQQ
ncbi:hypothetical protein DFS34DRAFT_644738 [Phlyctochytrium arcticum]|nr:hypothetical protein DFS34DRAFT_644738 [Phlyctochytrium arcticum]